jgi:hypothetical protein
MMPSPKRFVKESNSYTPPEALRSSRLVLAKETPL